MAAYWPNAPEEEQVVARPLNTLPKLSDSRVTTTGAIIASYVPAES